MYTSELELTDKCGEVICFRIRRMILCRNWVIVRIIVAAAVRDDTILWGQYLHLRLPGAVITLTSVKENERFALPLLDVMQFYATNTNLCRLSTLTNSLPTGRQKEQGK